jgi:hypothetical protein
MIRIYLIALCVFGFSLLMITCMVLVEWFWL